MRSTEHRPGRIGRNDACPCGSGLKYKRCCLEREQVALAPRRAGDAGGPLAVTSEIEVLQRVVRVLASMLKAGGALAELRFDPERFEAGVRRHFRSVAARSLASGGSDGRPPWEILMFLCCREIADHRWSRTALAALDRAQNGVTLSPEQRAALRFARDTLALESDPGAAPGLLVMALFPIQLEETLDSMEQVQSVVEELARGVNEGRFDLDTVSEAGPAWERVRDLLQSRPGLREKLSRQATEAVDKAMAWLGGPQPPPLLTADILIWLRARALDFPKVERDRDQIHELLSGLFVPLAPELRQACQTRARAASDTADRDAWFNLAVALTADPTQVIATAFRNPAINAASRLEGGADWEILSRKDLSRTETLASYEAALRAGGEAAAAERVAWAMERLATWRPGGA